MSALEPAPTLLWLAAAAALWASAAAAAAPSVWARATLAGRAIWAALGVLIAAPGLRAAIEAGYPKDSLFTLAPAQQAIVVFIALALSWAACWSGERIAARFAPNGPAPITRRLVRFAGAAATALALYAAAYVVSPQLFYTYYRTIFAGLPAQWVIDPPRQLARLGEAALLPPADSIADHGAGVLFWTLWALVAAGCVVSSRRRG